MLPTTVSQIRVFCEVNRPSLTEYVGGEKKFAGAAQIIGGGVKNARKRRDKWGKLQYLRADRGLAVWRANGFTRPCGTARPSRTGRCSGGGSERPHSAARSSRP